jgi:hypothetical protein
MMQTFLSQIDIMSNRKNVQLILFQVVKMPRGILKILIALMGLTIIIIIFRELLRVIT